MPIYEYKCDYCTHELELTQKIDDPAPACPVCKQNELVKQISLSSFQCKGFGWPTANNRNLKHSHRNYT